MTPKIYDYQMRNGYLGDSIYTVKDYFQYYTISVEDIIEDNPNLYLSTERYENERTEILTYKLFGNENLSDVILAINNNVYLWDTPASADSVYAAVEGRMRYLETQFKTAMSTEEIAKWENIFEEQLLAEETAKRTVILPEAASMQKVIRSIRKYFNSRQVT